MFVVGVFLGRMAVAARKLEGTPVVFLVVFIQAVVLFRLWGDGYGMTFLPYWPIPGDSVLTLKFAIRGLCWTTAAVFFALTLISLFPRRLGVMIWIFFLSVLTFHMSYRLCRGVPFDPRLILFNWELLSFGNSWKTLQSFLGPGLITGLIFFAAVCLSILRSRSLQPPSGKNFLARAIVAGICLAILGPALADTPRADKRNVSDAYILLRALMTSRMKYPQWMEPRELGDQLTAPFPQLVRAGLPGVSAKLRPDIFVLFLESFPAKALDWKLADGNPVAPALLRLRRESLSVENYFSNSVQTGAAYTAVHCGLIQTWRKASVDYQNNSFRCLPAILREAGYETILYYPMSANFDNMARFFKRNGFSEVVSFDGALPDTRCANRVIEGLRDDCLYANVLRDLSDRISDGRLPKGKPVYVSLLTTVNHFPFPNPEGVAPAYPGARSLKEKIINTAGLTDRFLASFLNGLKKSQRWENSLLLVLGDHGFPWDSESGGVEVGLEESHVRVPFLLRWPGRVSPRIIADQAFSHIDIAPTLMDLLGVTSDHSFTGRSIVDLAAAPRAVPLMQPYSGGVFGAAIVPYFYTFDRRSGEERFNKMGKGRLRLDSATIPTAVLVEARRAVTSILLADRLLKMDRIFPPEGE